MRILTGLIARAAAHRKVFALLVVAGIALLVGVGTAVAGAGAGQSPAPQQSEARPGSAKTAPALTGAEAVSPGEAASGNSLLPDRPTHPPASAPASAPDRVAVERAGERILLNYNPLLDSAVSNAQSLPALDGAKSPAPKNQVAFPGGVLGAPGLPPGVAGEPLQDGYVTDLIREFFPEPEWAAAYAVSKCESGQRNVVSKPNSNGTRDIGIFQLNDGGTLQGLLRELGEPETSVELALDARWNVHAASVLFSHRGWQPWVCAAKLGIYRS